MSLARSMAVASGTVYRDEAKLLAPEETGLLKGAIYLAFKDDRSNNDHVTYSITWNAKKAPHGHLVEFGHWRYNKIINGHAQKSLREGLKRGRGPEDHVGPGALDVPVWVPAHPFLRPAFDLASTRATAAGIARGRERLPELLRAAYQPRDDEFV
nr:HK97 gp10 family phage protein [Luteibacter jiangsuensis]